MSFHHLPGATQHFGLTELSTGITLFVLTVYSEQFEGRAPFHFSPGTELAGFFSPAVTEPFTGAQSGCEQ